MSAIREHESRLIRLRAWDDSRKNQSTNSDALYVAGVGSVLGLGIIWTLGSQYMKTTEIIKEVPVVKQNTHNGLELETDDEE